MSAKFKHCPFCGNEPVVSTARDVEDGFIHHYSANCFECGIEMSDEYLSELATNWNRRPKGKVKS